MKNGIDGSVIKSVAFKKASSAAWKILRFLILLCIGFALVYPFLYMISSTFRGEEDIWNPTIVWITRHYTLGNLKATMVNMNYSSSLVFSLQISVVTALLQCFMCAFAGYSFARYDFKLKGVLFGIVIFNHHCSAADVYYSAFSDREKFGAYRQRRRLLDTGAVRCGNKVGAFHLYLSAEFPRITDGS